MAARPRKAIGPEAISTATYKCCAGAVRFVQLIVHIRTITNVHRSGIGGEHGRHDLLLR
jgi:hypothetical protein